jgi:putative peptidoglycan lipid II flippase
VSQDLDSYAEDDLPPGADGGAGAQMTLFTVIVTAFLLVGKFAGLIKEHLLARFFGTTPPVAAFKVLYASVIFNFYSDAEQLLRPTYLPEFVRQKESDEAQAWRLTSVMATLTLVALSVVAAGLMIFARPLIQHAWPDLAADPSAYGLATLMLWIMSPALVLWSLSLMPELTLHAYKRFTLPALAETGFHLMVAAVLFVGVELIWHPGHPQAILAAAVGIALGGVVRLVVMLPGLGSRLRHFRFSLAVRQTPGVLTALRLMPALLVGLLVAMGRPVVDTMVATRLGLGMYPALDYGRKLSDGILTLPLALSLVVFPYVAEWAVAQDRRRLTDSLVKVTRAMAFLFIPFSIMLILLAQPLVRLVYSHGVFGEADVRTVSLALICYASGLFIYSVEGSLNKWYFALKDTWTPNWVGSLWAGAHMSIAWFLGLGLGRTHPSWGLMAVALALPLTKGAKVLTLYLMLRRRLEPVPRREIWSFLGKLVLSTAVMALIAALLIPHVAVAAGHLGSKVLREAALLVAIGGVSAVVYLAMATLLQIEEVQRVWGWLLAKLRRR